MSQQKVTRVMFIIDRSGSMQPIMHRCIDALNENIRTIKAQCAETGQDATVSLLTFDNEIEMSFFNRSIGSIKDIGYNDITPRGYTALFDAVGEGINQLGALPKGSADEDTSFLVITLTDGEENASKSFNDQSLVKLMQKVQATDMWTLTFLVPLGGRRTLVNRFSIPEGNVMEWDASAAGVKQYASANSAGITRFFRGRAAGERGTKSFYTDLSNVSMKEVRQLDDMSSKATILTVDRENSIKSFIESKGLTFMKGAAFYQLVAGKENADKVQDYKKILIMEKGKSRVFGGDDARQLLGLPDHETKVRPGDHGSFDIFIQSTSTNRKLPKGTRVIYMPSAAV